ncbi:MAG: M20/M25/M40 family metallo-hydrolase [Clostridia bacterium]|nr:M20/M25/M40 family metallo-hydrolase [Clostridia bacterium]
MKDIGCEEYAARLSRMIQTETISTANQTDRTKFYRFHDVLRELFPHLFAACSFEDFNGSFVLCLKGRGDADPVMLMNHQDVVEAPGEWRYPPFSGTIADGKLWGRGTLDTKGGLFAMLQAADELVAEGFVPERDIYFVSACTEETDGTGADMISTELQKRGLHFELVLDEGGMIVHEPIAGAKGAFALIGVGEKGCVDLKFIARSDGGHASTPERDTPLVRLGQFMAEVDRGKLFKADISPTVETMFRRVASKMSGPLKYVLRHSRLFKPLFVRVMPTMSPAANSMLKTTVAFTMASGSEGVNVLPQEAWVMGDMRYSHHQGGKASVEAITALAASYGIETVVTDRGFDSPLSDHKSAAFSLVESAIREVFPEAIVSPYVMTGASDCRFMSRVSENCLRFTPFTITDEQLDSIHGVDENVDLSALAPAVAFYRRVMTSV